MNDYPGRSISVRGWARHGPPWPQVELRLKQGAFHEQVDTSRVEVHPRGAAGVGTATADGEVRRGPDPQLSQDQRLDGGSLRRRPQRRWGLPRLAQPELLRDRQLRGEVHHLQGPVTRSVLRRVVVGPRVQVLRHLRRDAGRRKLRQLLRSRSQPERRLESGAASARPPEGSSSPSCKTTATSAPTRGPALPTPTASSGARSPRRR